LIVSMPDEKSYRIEKTVFLRYIKSEPRRPARVVNHATRV